MRGNFVSLGTESATPPGRVVVGESNVWSPSGWPLLLFRDHRRNVCVDVGLSGSGLAEAAAKCHPGVVVLTHADADHIGGFYDFLVAGARPREVWVPYEWHIVRQALHAISRRVRGTHQSGNSSAPGQMLTQADIDRIVVGTDVTAERCGFPIVNKASVPAHVLEATDNGEFAHPSLHEALLETVGHFSSDAESLREDDWSAPERLRGPVPTRVRAEIASVVEPVITAVQKSAASTGLAVTMGMPGRAASDIARRGVAVAEVIELALSAGANVRFFSVDEPEVRQSPYPYLWVGAPGVATLVNAIEVFPAATQFEQPEQAFLRVAYLTTTNRRALVTYLWNAGHGLHEDGGVLVWSDSAGEGCLGDGSRPSIVPWHAVSLMTAPHHGSANPAHDAIWCEWAHARTSTDPIPVIIAGGHPRQMDVATSFAKAFPRACTRCRHMPRTAYPRTVRASVNGLSVRMRPTC